MLSCRHTAQMEKTSNQEGKGKMKLLLAVGDYNKHNAGVDLSNPFLQNISTVMHCEEKIHVLYIYIVSFEVPYSTKNGNICAHNNVHVNN